MGRGKRAAPTALHRSNKKRPKAFSRTSKHKAKDQSPEDLNEIPVQPTQPFEIEMCEMLQTMTIPDDITFAAIYPGLEPVVSQALIVALQKRWIGNEFSQAIIRSRLEVLFQLVGEVKALQDAHENKSLALVPSVLSLRDRKDGVFHLDQVPYAVIASELRTWQAHPDPPASTALSTEALKALADHVQTAFAIRDGDGQRLMQLKTKLALLALRVLGPIPANVDLELEGCPDRSASWPAVLKEVLSAFQDPPPPTPPLDELADSIPASAPTGSTPASTPICHYGSELHNGKVSSNEGNSEIRIEWEGSSLEEIVGFERALRLMQNACQVKYGPLWSLEDSMVGVSVALHSKRQDGTRMGYEIRHVTRVCYDSDTCQTFYCVERLPAVRYGEQGYSSSTTIMSWTDFKICRARFLQRFPAEAAHEARTKNKIRLAVLLLKPGAEVMDMTPLNFTCERLPVVPSGQRAFVHVHIQPKWTASNLESTRIITTGHSAVGYKLLRGINWISMLEFDCHTRSTMPKLHTLFLAGIVEQVSLCRIHWNVDFRVRELYSVRWLHTHSKSLMDIDELSVCGSPAAHKASASAGEQSAILKWFKSVST